MTELFQDQKDALKRKCEQAHDVRSTKPEIVYAPIIKLGYARIERRRGRPPVLVWTVKTATRSVLGL